MNQEYNVPKAASLRKQQQGAAGEGEEGAEAEAEAATTGPLEAMAAGAGAKGKKDAADTVNIIKAVEEAKEEKALRGCVWGKGRRVSWPFCGVDRSIDLSLILPYA